MECLVEECAVIFPKKNNHEFIVGVGIIKVLNFLFLPYPNNMQYFKLKIWLKYSRCFTYLEQKENYLLDKVQIFKRIIISKLC